MDNLGTSSCGVPPFPFGAPRAKHTPKCTGVNRKEMSMNGNGGADPNQQGQSQMAMNMAGFGQGAPSQEALMNMFRQGQGGMVDGMMMGGFAPQQQFDANLQSMVSS